MASKQSIPHYRQLYATLLRLYPAPYYSHFGESMEQTFSDLLRERADEKQGGVFALAAWMFVETATGIMRENITFGIMRNKNILRIFLGTAVILAIPLIAMQFSDDVDWKLADFVIIGSLLIGTGLVYELVVRKVKNINYRIALGLALFAALFLAWVELAVGIFGSPFAGS